MRWVLQAIIISASHFCNTCLSNYRDHYKIWCSWWLLWELRERQVKEQDNQVMNIREEKERFSLQRWDRREVPVQTSSVSFFQHKKKENLRERKQAKLAKKRYCKENSFVDNEPWTLCLVFSLFVLIFFFFISCYDLSHVSWRWLKLVYVELEN